MKISAAGHDSYDAREGAHDDLVLAAALACWASEKGRLPRFGVHPSVIARPGEPFEALLFRFRRGVEASGILREARRRRDFIPTHERRREKVRAARRRRLRATKRGE